MANSSSSSSSLLIFCLSISTVTIMILTRSPPVEASKGYDMSWAMMASLSDHEFDMENDISRRFLLDNGNTAAKQSLHPKKTACDLEGKPYLECHPEAGIYGPTCTDANHCVSGHHGFVY